MKSSVYIAIIAVLFVTTMFFWHRSRELSYRLTLIQQRIEETRKEFKEKLSKERAERARREKEEREAREKARITDKGARIAIVVDDWGYNLKNLKSVLEIDAPITLSILPNLPYSERIARAANEGGKEVIVHLPLEPYEDLPLEKDTITTGMAEEDILEMFDRAVLSVPHLKGISNHMGSKATEDEATMTVILKRMKKNNLYFLDSLVTNKSVCRRLSRALRVKFAARSIFLDNELSSDYIRAQIEDLARHHVGVDRSARVPDRAA